jgi:integrase
MNINRSLIIGSPDLPPDEAYFFPGKPGKPISEAGMHDIMHDAIEKAGLQTKRPNAPIDRDDRTLHGLRYTFAVLGIEEGLPHDTVEAIVGHTTLAMAIKYTKKRRKSREAGAALNAAMKRRRKQRLAAERQQLLWPETD